MSSADASAVTTKTNVFDIGRYKTVLRTVETGTCCTSKSTLPVPPPKPLLIAMPSEAGEFPILVLLHGYLLYNSFYSQLMQHIASHGFIVIAPQASLSLTLTLNLTQACTILLNQMLDIELGFNKYEHHNLLTSFLLDLWRWYMCC